MHAMDSQNEGTHRIGLTALVGELERHPVNSNCFFESFKTQWLSQAQLQIFLRQYRYFCHHFVKHLEGLLYRTPVDALDMRVELIKTLHSELGGGDLNRAHITLLDRFAVALGLDPLSLDGTEPIPAVRSYLTTLGRLFLESDYLTALGAELAVEVTAASEFRYFYPGLKKYEAFSERDLAFFRLHLEEEVCHSTWISSAVMRTARSAGDMDRVITGARHTADAWHQFWLGVHDRVFGEDSSPAPSPSGPSRLVSASGDP